MADVKYNTRVGVIKTNPLRLVGYGVYLGIYKSPEGLMQPKIRLDNQEIVFGNIEHWWSTEAVIKNLLRDGGPKVNTRATLDDAWITAQYMAKNGLAKKKGKNVHRPPKA